MVITNSKIANALSELSYLTNYIEDPINRSRVVLEVYRLEQKVRFRNQEDFEDIIKELEPRITYEKGMQERLEIIKEEFYNATVSR